jgi:hypothetical protein
MDGPVVGQALLVNERVSRTNAWIRLDKYPSWERMPKAMQDDLMRICWGEQGLMITKDTTVIAGGEEVVLTPWDAVNNVVWDSETPQNWDEAMAANTRNRNRSTTADVKGSNQFKVDPAANYIFQVKELGWANIDRLMYDKGARPVDIITRVDNKDVGEVYISMVVKSRGMYLPGYEMKNGTYGFSHGDHEKMQLPVGVKATILATAYADGKPYVSVQDIVIAEKLNVDLHLEPTTKEDLRSMLEARL